jgi:hypothetical protein
MHEMEAHEIKPHAGCEILERVAKNGTDIKARMELMRHKTPSMTMRYSHLCVEYKRQAIAELPSFSAEMESQQISQQLEQRKVIAFDK